MYVLQTPFNGHLVILVGDVDPENLKDVPATDANPISGEVEGEGGGGEPLHVEGKGADHVHRSVEEVCRAVESATTL